MKHVCSYEIAQIVKNIVDSFTAGSTLCSIVPRNLQASRPKLITRNQHFPEFSPLSLERSDSALDEENAAAIICAHGEQGWVA